MNIDYDLEENTVKPLVLYVDFDVQNVMKLNKDLRLHWDILGFTDWKAAIARAKLTPQPDIVVVNISNTIKDPYDIIKLFKSDEDTTNLPLICVSTDNTRVDEVKYLDNGAIDFIPFTSPEEVFVKKISNYIELSKFTFVENPKRDIDLNYLTRLPGEKECNRKILDAISTNDHLALVHIDLDNLKPYNKKYGFVKGDGVIIYASEIISRIASTSDFVGHINGDRFIFITRFEDHEEICRKIIERFDKGIPLFYNRRHVSLGQFSIYNREGELDLYPLVSINCVALKLKDHKKVTRVEVIKDIIKDMQDFLQKNGNSEYLLDRRTY